jgi:hypothetical protein
MGVLALASKNKAKKNDVKQNNKNFYIGQALSLMLS